MIDLNDSMYEIIAYLLLFLIFVYQFRLHVYVRVCVWMAIILQCHRCCHV